ncbi:MAG: hypothetical protein ACR2J8_05830 [Thermomicrobiales bacterium]
MLDAAASEAAAEQWIDRVLADAISASEGAEMVAVTDIPVSPSQEADRSRWTHLWRCRPEGLPASRVVQCCTGVMLADGRCGPSLG